MEGPKPVRLEKASLGYSTRSQALLARSIFGWHPFDPDSSKPEGSLVVFAGLVPRNNWQANLQAGRYHMRP